MGFGGLRDAAGLGGELAGRSISGSRESSAGLKKYGTEMRSSGKRGETTRRSSR
jgi:hypothetical protein